MFRSVFSALAVLCLALPAIAQEGPPGGDDGAICIDTAPPLIPPDAAWFASQLAAFELPAALSAKQFQRLQSAARAFAADRDAIALRFWGAAVTDAYRSLGGLSGTDIETLAFAVLLQASKDMAEDIRAAMADVKRHNASKAVLRDYLIEMEDLQTDLAERCAVFRDCDEELASDVGEKIAAARLELVELGPLGDELGLKLQGLISRRARALEFLSNILKKMNDTAAAIVANLK